MFFSWKFKQKFNLTMYGKYEMKDIRLLCKIAFQTIIEQTKQWK